MSSPGLVRGARNAGRSANIVSARRHEPRSVDAKGLTPRISHDRTWSAAFSASTRRKRTTHDGRAQATAPCADRSTSSAGSSIRIGVSGSAPLGSGCHAPRTVIFALGGSGPNPSRT
ncbi:MAG: hypothetical protein U0414_43000 [Polyangiaceae bacterium]